MKVIFRDYEVEIKAKSTFWNRTRSNKEDTYNFINELICDYISLEGYLQSDGRESHKKCAKYIREDIEDLQSTEGFRDWLNKSLK